MRRILLGSLFWLACTGVEAEGGYTIVTEEWAPYNYVENGVLKGISVDIVEAIMAATDVRFRAMVLPSMRTTLALQGEPRTIMFSLFRTREREALYQWVGPILEESVYPYRLRQAAPPPRTLEELKAATSITTRVAGLVPRQLQALGFRNLDPAAVESEQLYKMLYLGRADIIVGDTDSGVFYYTRKLGFDPGALEKIPVEIVHSELYIAFSLDSDDDLVRSWNAALKTLKDQGKLEQIVAKYRR